MARKRNRKGLRFYDDTYWQSAEYNTNAFRLFRDQLTQLALSRVRWEGLPPTCDPRYLEWVLLTQGIASIAFPKSLPGSFFSTRLRYAGHPNLYSEPVAWESVGNNGWRFPASWDTGVVVYDTVDRSSLMPKLEFYAREMADVARTRQLNRMHQKTPYIVTGPKERVVDMANVVKQALGGEPAIIGTEQLSTITIEAVQLQVPYLGEQLSADLQNLWHEVYQLLGIANLPYKEERRIEDEVRDQEESTAMARLAYLEPRRKAADLLSERFGDLLGGPVTVTWNDDHITNNARVTQDIETMTAIKKDWGSEGGTNDTGNTADTERPKA